MTVRRAGRHMWCTRLAAVPLIATMQIALSALQLGPTMMPWDAPLPALWQHPLDLPDRNLLDGPWTADHAPDPQDEYVLVDRAGGEVRYVADRHGRKWRVQPATISTGSPSVV